MTLPVRSSTLPRAIQAGTIVTAFVGLPRLGQGGRVTALVISATNDFLRNVASHQAIRLLIVVKGNSSVTQRYASRLRRSRFRGHRVATLALSSHELTHVIRGTLLGGSLQLHVHHALSGLCDIRQSFRLSKTLTKF